MSTISSLGIGSGLDLSAIVAGLVEAERTPTENRLNAKEESATTKLSAFGTLKSSLSLFQGSLSSLQSSSTFNGKTVTSSDDSVLSTFASSIADSGSYAVEVTLLAKAHSLATSELTAFDSVDDTVGSGTLNIQFGSTTTGPYSFTADTSKASQLITVSEENNNTTLSGLRDYINDNDFGFSAAIVNDGNGYRLTLTSDESGAKNSMQITVTDDGDGMNDDNAGLSQLAFNADAQLSMGQTVKAQDAELTVNGLAITRESNSVTGAIDGVTLNLLKADIGNVLNVNVSVNTEGVKSAVEGFVEGYNGLVSTISTLSSYDSTDNSVGILIGDFTVRSLTSQLRSMLSTSVSQLSSNVQSLADIGIRTTDKGDLQLDSATLDDALSNFPDDVASLFNVQGRIEDEGIRYLASSDATLQGSYSVNISAMATQALYNGSTLNSLTINADNDQFKLRVNGVNSSTISLTQDVYTSGAELAAHIQAQINNDSQLKAGGVSVLVNYDSMNNRLDISSARYGSKSSIDIVSVDSTSANDLGFSVGSGTAGIDVAGTINGAAASGAGQILTSTGGDSNGLVLSVTSGSTGNRGSLTFTKGIASMLDNLLSSYLATEGPIGNREKTFNSELDAISEARIKLDLRVDSVEARLVKQFAALDGLIAGFNTTSSFLTQQLANLPTLSNSNK